MINTLKHRLNDMHIFTKLFLLYDKKNDIATNKDKTLSLKLCKEKMK